MKRKYFESLLLVFVALLLFPCHTTGQHEEDTWMEPDAWARDHLSLNYLQSEVGRCCKCSEESSHIENQTQPPDQPQQKVSEDAVSLMYFKKFIILLFNRKKLKYDSTLEIYERSLIFTLSSSQLEKLQRLQDPRDLDNILTEIFENVRIPNMYRDGHTTKASSSSSSGFKTLVFDIFNDVWQLSKTSEVRFLLIATLVGILGWHLNHRYHIGWLSLIFGGLFLYGYLHTYLECNRELEVNEMLEVLNRNKDAQQGVQKDSRFVSFLKGIFSSTGGNSQDLKEQQKLKKSAKISLGFCRPDHVIIMYFNDIFLKYLQVLLEQCTETLTRLKDGLPFPYNYFSGIMLICIVAYILKLTFKYILSPAAWSHLLHRNPTHSVPHQNSLTNTVPTSHNEDRISGENLKMLLNVINAVPQRAGAEVQPAVSGVEEVVEAIEAAPVKALSSSSSEESPASTPKHKNNNNTSGKVINANTQFTLEDCTE